MPRAPGALSPPWIANVACGAGPLRRSAARPGRFRRAIAHASACALGASGQSVPILDSGQRLSWGDATGGWFWQGGVGRWSSGGVGRTRDGGCSQSGRRPASMVRAMAAVNSICADDRHVGHVAGVPGSRTSPVCRNSTIPSGVRRPWAPAGGYGRGTGRAARQPQPLAGDIARGSLTRVNRPRGRTEGARRKMS